MPGLKSVVLRITADPNAPMDEEEIGEIDKALTNTWRKANRKFGEDPTSWREKFMAGLKAPKLVYFNTLDGIPGLDDTHDVEAPVVDRPDNGVLGSQYGQSYTQWINLQNADQSRSILPPGQSEHPDSPYHAVNFAAWKTGELHPAPISREIVETYVMKRVSLGKVEKREIKASAH